MERVKLLDCTLRDGGLGLEDAFINGISTTCFSQRDFDAIVSHLNKTNIDIVELGSIEKSNEDKTRFNIYQSIEDISKKKPLKPNPSTLYVALFRGPDTPLSDIPVWNPSLVEGIRVIIRYSELQKSLDFCAALSEKGYKVFVQPMLTMRYSDSELDLVIKASNDMNAFACYFVDSYGYMRNSDVQRLFNYYNERLKPNIRIGFHAHNNMNLAYSNAEFLIGVSKGRGIVIDACCCGMGQGAGNLQTELIVPYLNQYKITYSLLPILDVCEILDNYTLMSSWGYSVARLLPALYKTAYKYSIVYKTKYKLTYSQISSILETMEDCYRNRYTSENAQIVFKKWKVKNGN